MPAENENRIAAVLLSGGLDSMVVAALAQEQGYAVHALTIDYGQRHVRELQSARAIVEKLAIERHVELPLDLRQFGGSALTADIDVPKTGVGNDIPVTYVPARNLVFLALTTAFAETGGSRDIFIGVNALDKGIHTSWWSIRQELSTHQVVTVVLPTEDGRVLKIRKGGSPEPVHREIYETLRIPLEVMKPIKTWHEAAQDSD